MNLQTRGLPTFATLYTALQVCGVLVEGLYQLEVTVFGYDNPTGRCEGCGSSRGCCEEFASTSCSSDNYCDSYFVYCLRTLGRTGRGCFYFGNRISDPNEDDSPLSFSQSMVLGLENPIILQGLTDTYMGVQLHIEITDDDSNNADDLIDVLLINHNLTIGQPTPRQNYTGIYDMDFVTMDLSITARCVGNFEGPDCSRCISGFAGMMCNVRISECICSGRGQCLDGVPSLICDCDQGYTGVVCQNIDECVEVNCSGNGQCMDGELSYTCECDPGFTGVDCEVNIDDCIGMSCNGNGQCVDGIRSYTCDCHLGFTGMECAINIDDCVGVNCSGNGQCVDEVNSFSCNCSGSFMGPLCETRRAGASAEGERFSATFIGGITGVILSFTLLLSLLIVTVIIFIVICKKHKVCHRAKKEHMNTANLETPAVPLRYTKPHPHQPQDAEQETTRKFDNPIYGDDGDEVAGGARDNEPNMDQSRLLSMSLPDHEFDNPIYATEETNNPYSTITDASTQDSETNRQLQATYESIHDEQLPSSYRPLANGTFGQ